MRRRVSKGIEGVQYSVSANVSQVYVIAQSAFEVNGQLR